ncbi:MAG: hypothetical protein D6729_02815 [Deltaproteobacteria bacterium]|nr:MAG: hypothetical protein D6729_02815 [Deltaproteobacteria bacterium]
MGGGIIFHRAKTNPGPPVTLPWPNLMAGYRRGVLPWLDAGGRAWGFWVPGFFTFGVAADAKVQLLRGEGAQRWDLALAPTLHWQQANLGGAATHTFGMMLPLLIGWNLNERVQLIFSPRLTHQIVTSATQHTIGLTYVGLGIGVTAPVAENLLLLPEVIVQYTPVSFNGTVVESSRRGLTTVEFALTGHLDL